ncbi:MAG TPA: riboflavin synthase [Sedimentisphaerales bacterium]|nr:riboflavin synthase [Sedimentisphaerales bacterium]
MFTGIIEKVCTAKDIRRNASSMEISIDLGKLANDIGLGDSVAINGTCLTAVKIQGNIVSFELSSETITKSSLADIKPSQKVNVERAMQLSDRLGGHIVQGHVDGTATIKSITGKGNFKDITFTASKEILDQMITKGSVAIDGVSLTIAEMNSTSFKVAVIPQTLQETILSSAKVGNIVNIETDIIGKMVKKHVENLMSSKNVFNEDKLKELGY